MSASHSIENEFLNKITEIVEENISNEHYGVSELAREVGMSRSNLHRKVNSIAKISASQFIRQVRLKAGMEMLRQTSFTVSEVSYKVGFGSPSYFNKCFHDYYGYSPSKVGNRDEDESDSICPEKSIAVLPFENMSSEPDQEYFCDGITEQIINALAHVESLKVTARTSAFAFKDKHKDIREIGRKLNVETLLEGSIQKDGNRLRITPQLINVADGFHIWSERYDREMKDVFAIQDEISLAIVDNLKIKLLGTEKAGIVKRHTENLEAFSLYLKGTYYCQMMTAEGFQKALEYFGQSLQKDPNYALAYTGLAEVNLYSSYWGNVPPNEVCPKAIEYVTKALGIDNTLAEAYSLLGSINMNYYWNWKLAEREFKQALQLNPNSALIHIYYSMLLTFIGRNEEAISEAKRAQELDPLSGYINGNASLTFRYGGHYDKAIEIAQMTVSMYPNYWFSHHILGWAYAVKSMNKEAVAEFEKAVDLSGGIPFVMAAHAAGYYTIGKHDETEKLYVSLKKRSEEEYVPPISFYMIHAVRGELDLAYEWFERACNEHDAFLPWFLVYPAEELRIPDEPRYNALLKKVGLEK